VPGLANIWVPPIRNRIDMLATGIKSPVGVKVAGTDLAVIDRIAGEIEQVLKGVPGVSSALAERLTGGRYVDVNIDRDAAARYGLNIADVQSVISRRRRRRERRRDGGGPAALPDQRALPARDPRLAGEAAQLPIVTPRGAAAHAGRRGRACASPTARRCCAARTRAWRAGSTSTCAAATCAAVQDMQRAVAEQVKLPPGYSVSWSGQFEFLERATAKLKVVVPATLLIIFVLLYLTFRRFDEALLIMATLPFALIGGVWLLYLLGYNLSVAGVGFIALAGVAAEFGVIMLLYLKQAWEERWRRAGAATPTCWTPSAKARCCACGPRR
jgi:Cu(I)/Ag(I) efflux system membrane protein CusA/SilA